VGLTSVARIAQLADALPVRVKRRVLVLNKVGQGGHPEVAGDGHKVPRIAEVVRVPFDEDLYGRCARGEPLDDQAGPAARPAVEALARLCLPQVYQDLPAHP
jgi:hypothetical protein